MIMKPYLFNFFAVLFVSMWIGSASAAKNPIFESSDMSDSLADEANPYVEGEKWAETDIKIPPYPEDGDLMDLQMLDPDNRFQYYMDEKSLSVSKKDYVVRYTMVIEAKNGTRNVFYEGIRCNTSEYKTYAFAGGKGKKLRPRKKPEWKSVGETKYTRFRAFIMDHYFCEWRLPRQLQIIVNKVKYPAPGGDWRD